MQLLKPTTVSPSMVAATDMNSVEESLQEPLVYGSDVGIFGGNATGVG